MLMAGWPNFEHLTDVSFLKSISTDALARHTRPTLAAKFIAPSALRMIFTYPSQSEADRAIRVYHSAKAL